MTDVTNKSPNTGRRSAIKKVGALAVGAAVSPFIPALSGYAFGSGAPIKIGMQAHRTGIGASYGRWYERVATATVKLINEEGVLYDLQVQNPQEEMDRVKFYISDLINKSYTYISQNYKDLFDNKSFFIRSNRGLYAFNGTEGRTSIDGSTTIYGAELRSIGSANVYGTYGAVADGADCLMYLIQHNFAYIGAGTDSTNDLDLVVQANEVVKQIQEKYIMLVQTKLVTLESVIISL